MATSFMSQLERQLNFSTTENNAVGLRSTGRSLLDLNFLVASLRGASEEDIVKRFTLAYVENPLLALKWLFFARDVREGLGERRLFRIIMRHFSINRPNEVRHLVHHIAEYGRWDDLISLLETPVQSLVVDIIAKQLKADVTAMANGESVSLLAKWLPSTNASSKETVRLARMLAKLLDSKEPEYRRVLSKLRRQIGIVEATMSGRRWDQINYSAVPSKANILYKDAFLRHDTVRRSAFLKRVEEGIETINAKVAFPHDIVHRYRTLNSVDQTLEEMWKALPDTVDGNRSTIVVADGSGSMLSPIGGGTKCSALTVANSLAIYFAERLRGQFHNKYITFSENPQLVDFSKARSLRDKLAIANCYDEVANTDIEAVFELVLQTAVNGRMLQDDIPNILIISDMEFDRGTHGRTDITLFEGIARKFDSHGYQLPKLIFWNVNSRTGVIPVSENDRGVALVSGFSPNIAKLVMSGELDPYKNLVETLLSPRYERIQLPCTQ